MSDTKPKQEPDSTPSRGIDYAKAFRPEPCDLCDANQTARFIAKCTNWVVAAKIDSLEDCLILCLNLLTGDAAVWATAHIQTIGNRKMAIADNESQVPELPWISWKFFCRALKACFAKINDSGEAIAELQTLGKRGWRFSTEEYTRRFDLVAARSGLLEKDLVARYKQGLRFKIQNALALVDFDTLEAYQHTALTAQQNLNSIKAPRRGADIPNKTSSASPSSSSSSSKQKDSRKCYNCNKTGHILRDCKSPKKERAAGTNTEPAEEEESLSERVAKLEATATQTAEGIRKLLEKAEQRF